MIRKVSLFPEIARPLGLHPAVLDGLGSFEVLVGLGGSGKSRLLGLVRSMFELAPRTDEIRTLLSHQLAVAGTPTERERLERSMGFIDALAEPDAILVDGEQGLRRPSREDRCIDLTYGSDAASKVLAAAFPDLPRRKDAMSFAVAYRSAPAFLRKIARALFYGRLPQTASRPGIGETLREAEQFNEIARALLGKEVTPEISEGLEVTPHLGGRRFEATELSAGEGLLLTWAILLHKQTPSLRSAVVMIDEPELHLHPSLQQRILSSLLSVVGSDGQLWIATHSPAIAARPDVTNRFLLEQGKVRSLPEWPPSAPEQELGLEEIKPPHVLPSSTTAGGPIGESDFRAISRSASLIYVDKTGFIEDVLRNHAAVLLFPRPRRFGKSLNLSTLRYFVEKSPDEARERAAWFEGLRVWKSSEARQHFGRYPVIYLDLKNTKKDTFSSLLESVRKVVSKEYERHRYLLDGGALSPSERAFYEKIQRAEGTEDDYPDALERLSRHLEAHHGEQVVILVDEYDTPLNQAHVKGYLDEAAGFLGNFFSAGLKNNPHLFKGVLTGVLRIARESLFSDLNNLAVYSILRPEFATCFGFTEGEVEDLCRRLGTPELMNDLREWYNGYLFGESLLYNPWSVLSCLNSEDKRLDTYWADTSSNTMLRGLLLDRRGRGLAGNELLKLLSGETIEKPIDENLVLRSLDTAPDAVWSLLLFAGYLKPTEPPGRTKRRSMSLTVPNLEVRGELEGLVREFVSEGVGGEDNAQHLREALLRGEADSIQAYLNRFMMRVMSYFDTDRRQPELAYKIFLLVILDLLLPSHEVISELPSGRGRADVIVSPKTAGEPGICLELKVRDGEKAIDALLTQALHQIEQKGYVTRLEARGAHPIHKIAIVFDGQQAWVRRGQASAGADDAAT